MLTASSTNVDGSQGRTDRTVTTGVIDRVVGLHSLPICCLPHPVTLRHRPSTVYIYDCRDLYTVAWQPSPRNSITDLPDDTSNSDRHTNVICPVFVVFG